MKRNTKIFFCISLCLQRESIQLEIVNKFNRYVNSLCSIAGLTQINTHDNLIHHDQIS